MKEVLPWLVRWARHACTRDFCPALTALVDPIQNNFSPLRTLFQIIFSHRLSSWAGSRAGSPVS
jgi:hypothetical protein